MAERAEAFGGIVHPGSRPRGRHPARVASTNHLMRAPARSELDQWASSSGLWGHVQLAMSGRSSPWARVQVAGGQAGVDHGLADGTRLGLRGRGSGR